MNYTQSLDRLLHLGLKPEVSKPILNQVKLWNDSSGPEWTVQRLKTLKLWFIHKLSGNKLPSSQWISTDNRGIPKGVFKPIFEMKNLKKVMNTLLIYTSFVSKEVTKKQAKKFFSSVTCELGPSIHIPHLKDAVVSRKEKVPPFKSMNYSEYGWSPSKRTLGPFGKTVPEGIDALLADTRCSRVLDHSDIYSDMYYDALGDLYLQSLKGEELNDHPSHQCVGSISVIQEPGFKARFIANPRRIYQIMLNGLGKQAFGFLKTLPWDCTYNQMDGVEWVQKNLSNQQMVYCVDLSDATNNFPLEIQMKIARWLGFNEDSLMLFEDLARSEWYVPKSLSTHYHMDTVRWTKGQPLGLYPSFPLFSIAHGFLVESLRVHVNAPKGCFRILGDDIAISDKHLFKAYMEYLDLLQMPVSFEKCISSHLVAEFAGCIITPDRIFSGVKWRSPTPANRLSLIQSLPSARDLTDKTEFLSYLLRQAPSPFGSNTNSEGLPLQTRCNLFAPWYLFIKEKEGHIELERSTKKELHYSSAEITNDLAKQKVLLSRQELEALLPDCLNDNHMQQQWDDRKISSSYVLSHLIEMFQFKQVDVPDWFIESREFSEKHRDYLLVHMPQAYEHKSNFVKMFYKKMCTGSYNWCQLAPHRRQQVLDDIRDLYFSDSDEGLE